MNMNNKYYKRLHEKIQYLLLRRDMIEKLKKNLIIVFLACRLNRLFIELDYARRQRVFSYFIFKKKNMFILTNEICH